MLDALLGGISALVIGAINAVIYLFGAILAGLFSLLPNMPDLPTPPTALVTAEGWVAWFFPVSTVIDILVFTLSMWLLFQAIALAMRWAKAGGDL
jgi:hypothetical protein